MRRPQIDCPVNLGQDYSPFSRPINPILMVFTPFISIDTYQYYRLSGKFRNGLLNVDIWVDIGV